jgi:hypothetical protein
VKNRTRVAKLRFIERRFLGQIFHQAHQAPGQHQAKTQEQEHSDCDIHDVTALKSTRNLLRILKFEGFWSCRTTLILMSERQTAGGV